MKRISLILILIFISVLFSACVYMPTVNNTRCVSCIDVNGDNLCDKCNKALPPKKEPEAVPPEHTECVDTDGDVVCDECDKKLENTETSDPIHTECVDKNKDAVCDVCEEILGLYLIEKGELKFSLVYSSSLGGNIHMKLDELVDSMDKLGYTLEKNSESRSNASNGIEVLVGTVTSRGDKYAVDGRDYGYSGYTVKIIDDKVIIAAGCDEALVTAISYFKEEILKITDKTTRLNSALFLKSESAEHYHEYKISSLSIGGRKIDGYVIAVDKSDVGAVVIARDVSEKLFKYAGYVLDIVDISETENNYILISHREKSGGEGFEVLPLVFTDF